MSKYVHTWLARIRKYETTLLSASNNKIVEDPMKVELVNNTDW